MTQKLLRNLLLSAVVFAVTLGVVAAVGEYAVRRRERTRDTVPGSMPFAFYRHNRYGHALVRGNDYFGWVHVNSLGFRGAEVALEKPPGVTRIVVMGGSTTFDTFVSADNRTWPARMEHWLKQLSPQTPVEVINAGVPGYVIADDFLRLQTEIAALHPDIIVQMHGHNDFNRMLGSAGAVPSGDRRPGEVRTTSIPGVRWLERHSLLYTKVAAKLTAMGWGRRSGSGGRARVINWKATVDNATSRFEREMSAFGLTAKMLGARVVLTEVVHAAGTAHRSDSTVVRMWRYAIGSVPLDTALWAYERFNAATRQSAQSLGLVFAPASEWNIEGPEHYAPDDPIHFNDAGADLMGHRMAELVIRSGLLLAQRTKVSGAPAATRPRPDTALKR